MGPTKQSQSTARKPARTNPSESNYRKVDDRMDSLGFPALSKDDLTLKERAEIETMVARVARTCSAYCLPNCNLTTPALVYVGNRRASYSPVLRLAMSETLKSVGLDAVELYNPVRLSSEGSTDQFTVIAFRSGHKPTIRNFMDPRSFLDLFRLAIRTLRHNRAEMGSEMLREERKLIGSQVFMMFVAAAPAIAIAGVALWALFPGGPKVGESLMMVMVTYALSMSLGTSALHEVIKLGAMRTNLRLGESPESLRELAGE